MSVSRPQYGVRFPAASSGPRLLHRRTAAAAAALGLALLAAVLAGIWAGRQAAPAESPAPAPVRQVSAGDARLTVPASWRPASLGVAGLRGLPPARSAALSLRADVPTWAVATTTPADHASLVPLVLRRLVEGPLPPPRETRLGDRGAWLYTGLTTRGGRALELTVQPTTAGVLAVACVSRASARPPEALCGGAISSATVIGATTLVPGPAVALALWVKPRLQALDGTRVELRASLSRAESAGAQQEMARRLAGAHLGEAKALAPLAATAGAPLVRALRKVGSAYVDLATAAAGGSRAAFSNARQDVDAVEARLADAVGSVSRIAPEPAPSLPSTASPPATGPSSLLLMLAIVSLAAALAFVRGPRARDRPKETRAGSAPRAPMRQPTSGHAEPAKAPAPRGASPKRAAATPRANAPARRSRPPARPRPTTSAMPGAPVTKPRAQPVAAPRPDASARRTKRSDPSPTTPSTTRAPARQGPPGESAAPPARRAKLPAPPFAAPAAARPKPPAGPAAAPHAKPARRTKRAAPASAAPATPRKKPQAEPTAVPSRAAIPTPARSATGWTCEITWRAGLRAAAFLAAAARPGGDPQEIAESTPMQWPPVIPPAPTPDLEEALAALEERLIAAGWTPIKPRGREWYRRRFAWTAAEPPRPLPTTAWPDSVWTCEIVWKAGLRGAGFHAHAARSGERKQLVVARSPKLEWPPLLPPSPNDELVAAADGVERALIASGWKPSGRGTAWYAHRFAWTSDDAPVAASG